MTGAADNVSRKSNSLSFSSPPALFATRKRSGPATEPPAAATELIGETSGNIGAARAAGGKAYAEQVTSPIDLLAGLFAGEGLQRYLGEDLSIAAHMLQAGALAESAGAPSALVVAALLHDVGHFGAIAPRQTGAQQLEATDHRHQEIGADWLAKWFPQAVTEPVRLHVLAKRYLCSVESGYLETLSPASVHTLALQGGPLTASETWAFERLPYARDAVAMRRWDEVAKDPAVATPPFEHFREILAQARKR